MPQKHDSASSLFLWHWAYICQCVGLLSTTLILKICVKSKPGIDTWLSHLFCSAPLQSFRPLTYTGDRAAIDTTGGKIKNWGRVNSFSPIYSLWKYWLLKSKCFLLNRHNSKTIFGIKTFFHVPANPVKIGIKLILQSKIPRNSVYNMHKSYAMKNTPYFYYI